MSIETTPPTTACSAGRMRWRKRKRQAYQPEMYELRRNGEVLITIQEKRHQWYWYGAGKNSCAKPMDLESAKRDAEAHINSLPNV